MNFKSIRKNAKTVSEDFIWDMFQQDRKTVSRIKRTAGSELGDKKFALEIEFNFSAFKSFLKIQTHIQYGKNFLHDLYIYLFDIYEWMSTLNMAIKRTTGQDLNIFSINREADGIWILYPVFMYPEIEGSISARKYNYYMDKIEESFEKYIGRYNKLEPPIPTQKILEEYKKIFLRKNPSLEKLLSKLHTIMHNDFSNIHLSDIEELILPNLKWKNWEVEYDGPNIVEFTTGPVHPKDANIILKDLKYLSQFKRDPGLSCHVHVDKGRDFESFEKFAVPLLMDEEGFYNNPDLIGVGRKKYANKWAKSVINEIKKIANRKGITPTILSYNRHSYVLSRDAYYFGIISDTYASSKDRTVEFRYASATVLDNPSRVIEIIKYFSLLVSLSKQVDSVIAESGDSILILLRTKDKKGSPIYHISKKTKSLSFGDEVKNHKDYKKIQKYLKSMGINA